MAYIPQKILSAVVKVGTRDEIGQESWFGTGFLFDEDQKNDSVFFVTNKHVFVGVETIILDFRKVNSSDRESVDINLAENGREMWIGHPDAEIDIAVVPINRKRLHGRNLDFSSFGPTDCLQFEEFGKNGIGAGTDLFVIAFPISVVSEVEDYPYTRKGVVAEVQALTNDEVDQFVIDGQIFPGNSGGPVLVGENEGKEMIVKLIGVVRGLLYYSEEAQSIQSGRTRVIFEENSGLTVVETFNSVKECIDKYKK
jgi:S1-C subfamily serine protease